MRRFRSALEKAELVEGYMVVPHGRKLPWLAERGISQHLMGRWRRAYMFGDLDRGLVPRDTSQMDPLESARTAHLQRQLAEERAARLADQQRHDEEVARLQAVTDALGKAIELLHDHAVEPEPTDEP